MREKWHIKNKKGYLKIHVAVNVKTKKILSIKVTDEHVHDSKALPKLVENIIKSDSITTTAIGKLFCSHSTDGNNIFRCLAGNGILPCIKVRKNAKIRWKKGNILRNLSLYFRKRICKPGKTALDFIYQVIHILKLVKVYISLNIY